MLTGPEARHAATVQRLGPGEAIEIVDGAGVRLRGVVGTANEAGVDGLPIEVGSVVHEDRCLPTLTLVQALAKGGRDEMAIEAATEIGVDAVQPWQSARSVVQWRGDRSEKGARRWEAITQAAAKVARRSRLPQVREFLRGDQILTMAQRTVDAGGTVLVLHELATEPLAAAELAGEEIAVVIGPEGGLTEDEVDALARIGARTVLLGSTVLRSSTAGPAALSVLSARLGRWG